MRLNFTRSRVAAFLLLVCVLLVFLYLIGPQTLHQESELSASNRDGLQTKGGVYGLQNEDRRSGSTTSLCSGFYQHSDSPVWEPIAVCGSRVRPVHHVKCYKSSVAFQPNVRAMLGFNSSTATIDVMCTLENIAVTPTKGKHYISNYLSREIDFELAPSLLNVKQFSCPVPTLVDLMLSTETNDHMRTFVQESLKSRPTDPSHCQVWVNETTYFFAGSEPHNVFFIFLTYYNIYHTIGRTAKELNHNSNPSIVRFSGNPNRRFKDFEVKLFPEMYSRQTFDKSKVVCFRKVIVVPRCYNSLPFQCVKQQDLQKFCLKCTNYRYEKFNKHLLYTGENSLLEFRRKVLSACNIDDLAAAPSLPSHGDPKRVIFIRRKPYVRNGFDSQGMFQRILANEEELLSSLADRFPSTQMSLSAVYMEDFDICAQIELAHSADVLLGVHGAGLVHLWWLKEDAWVLELVPESRKKRPTYEALSSVLGRNYCSIPCLKGQTGDHSVTANVDDVVETLAKVLVLRV